MTGFDKTSVTAEAAEQAIAAAVRKATENGVQVAVAVCDESGHQKAFRRMDGASFGTSRIADDKAYTAAAFGLPTQQWYAVFEGDAPLRQGMLSSIDRLCTLGGGVPIVFDGSIIGGIGVSGGTYDQDHEAAEAAVVAITR